MRTRIATVPALTLLSALLFACGGSGSSAPPPPVPSVTVLAPNGGESWTAGTSATITWSSSAFTGTLDVELSTDGGATWTILAADTADDGTELVTVPAVASATARVQVSAADGDPGVALAPSDVSDAVFAIAPPPSLTILSPNGGETWLEGGTQTVAWQNVGLAGTVDVDYSIDGGTTWLALVSGTPNDGSEIVTAPHVASGTVRLQVSVADGDPSATLAPADVSDADFTIAPRLVVTSPNGGEDWRIGSTVEVTWDPGAYLGNVDVELSIDGGTTWAALASNTPNDGTESVLVPVAPTPTARVQVSAADGLPAVATAPADRSDAAFHVGGPPVDIGAGLPGIGGLGAGPGYCALAWGDYDDDGDLDLALAGEGAGGPISRIYRNDDGTFSDIAAGLPGVGTASIAWGDYDDDGDLDLALTGWTGSAGIARIYRNTGGIFTDVNAGLPGVYYGSLAWGDYDDDGDLDLALAGYVHPNSISRIYRNDKGTFTDAGAGLRAVMASSVAWGDYDNDGDLDLALSGYDGGGNPNGTWWTLIYRNDAGSFTDIQAGLPGLSTGSLAWGDYDGDGDLDLALAGSNDHVGALIRTQIYRNDAGTFVDIGAGLPSVWRCSLVWGDYDADGDLDLAMAGAGEGLTPVSRIYRNDGGAFTDTLAGLPDVSRCALGWGDYDRDGDLDLALAGYTGSTAITRIYRNDGGFAPNTPPSAPTEVLAMSGGGEVLLSWLPSTDLETPADGLSYNLRIGKTTTDDCAFPSMADGTGLRTIPARGPIAPNPFFVSAWLKLPPGVYYASVQAVDTSFEGGPWSEPVPFVIP